MDFWEFWEAWTSDRKNPRENADEVLGSGPPQRTPSFQTQEDLDARREITLQLMEESKPMLEVAKRASPVGPLMPPLDPETAQEGVLEIARNAPGVDAGMARAEDRPLWEQAMGLIPGGRKAKQVIKAYHGSPHDFDKFKDDAIGTGEGAAAFGRGHYFAENPAVAEFYREQLSGRPPILKLKVGNKSVGTYNNFDYSPKGRTNYENIQSGLIEDMLIHEPDLMDANQVQPLALRLLDNTIEDYKENWPEGVEAAKKLRADLAKPGAVSIKLGRREGATYEVEIDADPDKFIDLDKRWIDQSPEVLEMVGWSPSQVKRHNALQKEAYHHFNSGNDEKYKAVKAELDALVEEVGFQPSNHPRDRVGFQRSPGTGGELEGEFEEYMKKRGAQGFKYKDQSSRFGGPEQSTTRNYVVFDPETVRIVRKYGIPVAVSLGYISQQEADQMKEQGLL